MSPRLAFTFLALIPAGPLAAADPADLIVRRAEVVTVDAKFSTAEAVAVRGEKIVAVGSDAEVIKLADPKTRIIDASGKTVLPGGGDSDHMIRLDPRDSTNPWDPWPGKWAAVTRTLERGDVHRPQECLTRELAVRLDTINNAYLHHEEKAKGSPEPGKLADLILIDRDVLTCPADDIKGTKVLITVVGGKVVYEAR